MVKGAMGSVVRGVTGGVMTGAGGGTTLGAGGTLGSGGATTGSVTDCWGMEVGLGIVGGIVARFKICATCTYALQIAEPYCSEGVRDGLV